MITKFRIENFKRIEKAELDLGEVVVFIGPNNSGKTTALQALALWDVGWRRWSAEGRKKTPAKRPGMAINRKDLYSIPLPSVRLLWNDLRFQTSRFENKKQINEKIYITLTAEGVYQDKPWTCSLEFYYANEESLYCRLKDSSGVPAQEAMRLHPIVFLPPMSGLAEREHRKEPGEISVLIGEGQTAQVLRNLCWQLYSQQDKKAWAQLVSHVESLFQIQMQEPVYVQERSELTLTYKEVSSGVELDLSSSGRGCQQVILLLSYILANPGAVLLLDEPDAHLEILRQRDVYNLLTETAAAAGSQIVAASHSEVVLQEAGERDVVIAFVGKKPHRIDTRSRHQVRKALENIHMADYFTAEQKGWMLYLEGSTDLSVLRRLAERLNHPAQTVLHDSVPVSYLGSNKPQEARDHFYGLCEAKKDLIGFALFDRLDKELHVGTALTERMWARREIENYLVTPESLRAFVQQGLRQDDLFDEVERKTRLEVLEKCLSELTAALKLTNKPDPWGPDIKVTDEFLDPLFHLFYERIGTPQKTYKRDYHGLADAIPTEQIAPEVSNVLDGILEVYKRAKPAI